VRFEIHRVQREIRGIFQQYLLQLQQLGPLTVTGNPPTIQGNGYEAQRILGGLLNYDLNMSPLRNVACGACQGSCRLNPVMISPIDDAAVLAG
jgi:hypothetical protein